VLDVADIEENEAGLLVTIRGSKTDQEHEGATIAIPRGDIACPVKALRAWLDAAGIEAGPIFRPINKVGRPARCGPRGLRVDRSPISGQRKRRLTGWLVSEGRQIEPPDKGRLVQDRPRAI
jgi:hypothetical protein